MNSLTFQSPAKINLGLKVLFKRMDNYHEIETILQQVSLSDFIHFENRPGPIKLTCTDNSLVNSENLIFKAAILLSKKSDPKKGAHIHLEKNIPIAAGLGGGSSNAAITIWALNQLWELNLKRDELIEIAKELGADVPFFLYGARAIGKGRGDQLSPLHNYSKNPLVLVNPGFPVPTSWVYRELNLRLTNNKGDIKLLILSLKNGDIQTAVKLLFNDLESVFIHRFPILKEIKILLLQSGASGTIVSGSGPTIFAIFESMDTAFRAAEIIKNLRRENWKVFLAETLTEEEVSSSILRITPK